MFEVEWTEEADRELEDLWRLADIPTRGRMLDVIGVFDSELSNWADRYGESRSGSLRIAIEPPLAILFEVEEQAVRVVHVMRYGK